MYFRDFDYRQLIYVICINGTGDYQGVIPKDPIFGVDTGT